MRSRWGAQCLPDPLSCAQAREAALRVLAEVDASPDLAERVLLVVTELVSNARRHAGGVTGFDVSCRDGRLTVAVSDRSTRSPRLRPQAPRMPGGFGWRLVTTLAPGTFIRFHRGGKTVIATLPTLPLGA